MKVIAYGTRRGDMKDASKKNLEIQEERKKFPDRYPKPISPSYNNGCDKLIRLYDGTEEQLLNLATRWVPEISYKFVVVFEGEQSRTDAAKRIGLTK